MRAEGDSKSRQYVLAWLLALWFLYAVATALFWLLPFLARVLLPWLLLSPIGLTLLTLAYWARGSPAPFTLRLRREGAVFGLLVIVQIIGNGVGFLGFPHRLNSFLTYLGWAVVTMVGLPMLLVVGASVSLEAIRRSLARRH